MDCITQKNNQKQVKKEWKQNLAFEISRKSALACLKKYPQAQVVFRGQSKAEKLKWTPLNEKQIKQKTPGFFAVILESLGLDICMLDFDLKSDSHKSGMAKDTLLKIWAEWGLNDYIWTQTSPSGGKHALFKNAPKDIKSGSNKMGSGIDYATGRNLFMLYDDSIWNNSKQTLRPLPPLAIQSMEKIIKEKRKLKGGHGKTNNLLNSVFTKSKKATSLYQLGDIAWKTLQEYEKNPGKTSLIEAKTKLGKSLAEGLAQNKTLIPQPTTMTKSPEFIPIDRFFLHNIIPRGQWITLVGETGTGKTAFICHIIAKSLKESHKTRRAYVYTQESDWNNNIVPSFLAEGLTLKQIENQVIYKECVSYETEKIQVLYDISQLTKGDFVLIEPTPIIAKNPNDSKEVPQVIKEYQDIAKANQLFMFGLHHTTTGWSGTTLKEQGKFCKEWISYPRHCLILKEKQKDGDCIAFISKSNLMQRIGAIEFEIKSKNIQFIYKEKKYNFKNYPYIPEIKIREKLTTKDILQTFFKKEAGVETPRQKIKDSTVEIRNLIIRYIYEKQKESPDTFQYVLRAPLLQYCTLNTGFNEDQFNNSIKALKKLGFIKIDSGAGNRSEYSLTEGTLKFVEKSYKESKEKQHASLRAEIMK